MKRKDKCFFSVCAIIILTCLLLISGRLGCYFGRTQTEEAAPSHTISNEGDLRVHFLDVGQGDSSFVELPDGRCMLVDASEEEYGDKIVSYISGLGYSTIDYVVATHPHSDHIGGMAQVINSFEVGTFCMPEKEHTTKTFEKMLRAVEKNGCDTQFISAGDIIFEGDYLKARVVAPIYDDYEDLNNFSAVIHISYGDTAFLLTGDAEDVSEEEILKSGADISADVLKVGHHGSSSSSIKKFVNAVSPDYAVISCGEDNEYGFPKKSVVNRFKKAGAEVLITWQEGDMVFTSDGEAVDYR